MIVSSGRRSETKEFELLMDYLSIGISVSALLISAITMWLALFHRGRLKMTKPNVVFFGYDFTPKITPKVFLRTLLFSTAARGIVIESMYVNVSNDGRTETFSFWGYGETNNLVPGSGLFVDKTGLAANHHFVLSVDKPPFPFEEGDYKIDVFAKIVGKEKVLKLSTIDVTLTAEHAQALSGHDGVLFELSPETQEYAGHINRKSQ